MRLLTLYRRVSLTDAQLLVFAGLCFGFVCGLLVGGVL